MRGVSVILGLWLAFSVESADLLLKRIEPRAQAARGDPPVSLDQLSGSGPGDTYLNIIPTVKKQGVPPHTMTTVAEQFAFASLGSTAD